MDEHPYMREVKATFHAWRAAQYAVDRASSPEEREQLTEAAQCAREAYDNAQSIETRAAYRRLMGLSPEPTDQGA
jgi:hypothetical protein